MTLSYQAPGLVLGRAGGGTAEQVKDLQRDLRRLGYLATGIDGDFGRLTERAVKALQYDLLHNRGEGPDGNAPVRVRDYNRSRVAGISGVVDQNLAACIADMLADERFLTVPSCANPREENDRVSELAAQEARPAGAPAPFLAAILKRESGLRHYREPEPDNDDSFVLVGLDRNAAEPEAVTSRGFGVGQYTLFHHPPAKAEFDEYVADAAKNLQHAALELRDKFDRFVNGNTPGTRADDRQAEFGRGPLRVCKYAPSDPRFLTDCRRCLQEAGTTEIRAGVTRFYEGARPVYEPTQYHPERHYEGVPVRARIGCDWPYAVRRYNGGGLNSYHYQTKVLLSVL